MLNGLDLFSGYGGLTLALSEYIRPIAYCEIEKYCQAILISRMDDGKIPYAPICTDINSMSEKDLPSEIDIIYGGFPCQDLSVAGNGKGLEGKRSGLFYELLRLSKEIKPKFIFLENVPGIRTKALHTVGIELANLGYDCRWLPISAEEIGACHKRVRWFCLAKLGDSKHNGSSSTKKTRSNGKTFNDRSKKGQDQVRQSERADGISPYVADSKISDDRKGDTRKSKGQIQQLGIGNGQTDVANSKCNDSWKQSGRENEREGKLSPNHMDRSWWFSEPSVGRMVDGIAFRVDRIKAVGNGVVPQQAKIAFEILLGIRRNIQ